MKMSDIIIVAEYQQQHFAEYEGEIKSAKIENDTIKISIGNMEFKLSNFAKTELLRHFGLNGTMSDFKNDNSFLSKALDRKIETKNQRFGIRVIYNDQTLLAHGIKTKRYQRIYNKDLLDTLNQTDYTLDEKTSSITDEYMILNFISEEKSNLKVGDFLHGINITNSEVGYMALGVKSYLQRLQCLNGMVSNLAGSNNRLVHVYRDLNEKFIDLIYATEHERSLLEAIQAASNRELYFTEEFTLSDYLAKFNILKKYHDGIDKQIGEEYLDDTVFNIYNGVSRYATHEIEDSMVQQTLLIQASQMLFKEVVIQ